MLPSAVAEQQAKLGVSAEESKAQRLKRQQARFRDRGGAFVPCTSNPLVNILLARTVSGESPSKPRSKDVAKRPSSSKARQASPTKSSIGQENQAVAGRPKSKLLASVKGKAKAMECEGATEIKPPPKRRGTGKGRKKAQDLDSDMERPIPADRKPKSTTKSKGKQRAAPSTSDKHPKAKPQQRAKTKTNLAKKVVEIFVSDDDQTLVEVPHKAKSNPKRRTRYEGDSETDDDVPIVRQQAMARVHDSRASSTKTTARVKAERTTGTGNPRKKALESGEDWTLGEPCPRVIARKRPALREEEDVAGPPAKKGKTANSTSAKSKATTEPEPELALRLTRDVRKGEASKAPGQKNGKVRAESIKDVTEPVETNDHERPLERASTLKKRKKEDNNDDRPRKVVKFSDTCVTHSSSERLKENRSDEKRAVKSGVKDELDVLRKLATRPSRAETPKGPPREVLERIKASATRHLRCVDSEPDELDCLS